MSSKYLYVTYIRTTPKKLWDALTQPEFQRQYWFGMHQDSGWTKGSAWAMKFSDGRTADAGEILESDPPNRLVIKWRNEFREDLKAEGYSRCVYEIAEDQGIVKLTITHTIDVDNAKLIEAVSGGWPRILSSLKTVLEGGTPLPRTHEAAKS